MKVVLASKNRHKLEEVSKITEKFDFELVLQSDLGVDIDVEENGTTFEENSFIKAEAVMKATGLPALADDSGIAVDALNGEPGIYSARYGFDDSLDDWGRLQLLLKNTEHVPDGQRQAQQRQAQTGDRIERANKEIGILENSQSSYAQYHGNRQPAFPFRGRFSPSDSQAAEIEPGNGRRHQQHIFRFPPGVKHQAEHQQYSVLPSPGGQKINNQHRRKEAI